MKRPETQNPGPGWCEIFRAGRHVDSRGRAREWTTSDLDRLVSSYDPTTHEAPICLDHEEGTGAVKGGPAYGWVESLKRVGESVWARFKKVVPEFADAVERGLYRKRSVSIYPDGSLRHVAWLGAQPPAVKGLADFTFAAGDAERGEPWEYVESTKEGPNPMPTIEELQAQLEEQKKATADANATAEKATAHAADLAKENEKLAASFKEAETKRRRAEIETFVDTGVADGKILPAWKDAGLVEFMSALEPATETYQFSEGAEKKTPLDWFKGFLASFSEHPLFESMAKGAKKAKDNTDDADKAAEMLKRSAGVIK